MDAPPDIGTVLPGGQRLARLVGEDALGRRFAARDAASRKQVAVLLIDPPWLAGDGAQVFERACGLWATLDRPEVLPVLGWGRVGAHGYLVSPWVGSATLHEALASPLLMSTAVHWASDIAAGLGAGHAIGLLHQGLSPACVRLVRRNEPPDQARVDGFGLAPLLALRSTSASGLPTQLGGAAWTSPEQALGRELDARSDLYALGAVLFHGLTGRPPFTGPSVKVLAAHADRQAPPPSSLTTGIPHWLDEIVLALLEKRPEDRPSSADEVIARLTEGAALLVDGAAHPERVTATVAPRRLPGVEIRGAASQRTPARPVPEPAPPIPSPVSPVALAAMVGVGAVATFATWWLFGGIS